MKNAEISKVLIKGKSYKSNSFLLKILPNELDLKKVSVKPAFISGKKIFKTAVIRNKSRRRAKAAFVKIKKQVAASHYIVFNLYKEVLTVPIGDLVLEMKNTLEKGGMLTR